MSLLEISFINRFCVSRKGEIEGGEWVQPKGAKSITMSGFGFSKALAGTMWIISLLLWRIGLRKQSSHLVGTLFLALKVFRPFFCIKRITWNRLALVPTDSCLMLFCINSSVRMLATRLNCWCVNLCFQVSETLRWHTGHPPFPNLGLRMPYSGKI